MAPRSSGWAVANENVLDEALGALLPLLQAARQSGQTMRYRMMQVVQQTQASRRESLAQERQDKTEQMRLAESEHRLQQEALRANTEFLRTTAKDSWWKNASDSQILLGVQSVVASGYATPELEDLSIKFDQGFKERYGISIQEIPVDQFADRKIADREKFLAFLGSLDGRTSEQVARDSQAGAQQYADAAALAAQAGEPVLVDGAYEPSWNDEKDLESYRRLFQYAPVQEEAVLKKMREDNERFIEWAQANPEQAQAWLVEHEKEGPEFLREASRDGLGEEAVTALERDADARWSDQQETQVRVPQGEPDGPDQQETFMERLDADGLADQQRAILDDAERAPGEKLRQMGQDDPELGVVAQVAGDTLQKPLTQVLGKQGKVHAPTTGVEEVVTRKMPKLRR